MNNVSETTALQPVETPGERTANLSYDAILQALADPKHGTLHMLTLDQHRFLAESLSLRNDAEACKAVGISRQLLRSWRRTSAGFQEAEAAVADSMLKESRSRLSTMLPKATDALDEALDAEKPYDVTCPACEHEFTIMISDLKARLDVAKELFKRTGDFGTKIKVDVETTTRSLTFEDQIALAQLSRGDRLPPDVLQSLQRRGLVTPEMMRQAPIEGTVVSRS